MVDGWDEASLVPFFLKYNGVDSDAPFSGDMARLLVVTKSCGQVTPFLTVYRYENHNNTTSYFRFYRPLAS